MEELIRLREHIVQERYEDALTLISEMEEMSREDKINKIRSYIKVLLLHLIKQAAEKRTTRSWDISIRNAIREINYVNHRRKAKGTYLDETELQKVIAEAYQSALEKTSLEAFEGIYDDRALAKMVDQAEIEQRAWHMILAQDLN